MIIVAKWSTSPLTNQLGPVIWTSISLIRHGAAKLPRFWTVKTRSDYGTLFVRCVKVHRHICHSGYATSSRVGHAWRWRNMTMRYLWRMVCSWLLSLTMKKKVIYKFIPPFRWFRLQLLISTFILIQCD